MQSTERIIADIGMADGADTAFYLAKGFTVVGVEADSRMIPVLRERFADEINSGKLTLLHAAASETSGKVVNFAQHEVQVHSKVLSGSHDQAKASASYESVTTMSWGDLLKIAPEIYYCKVDIEGHELPFVLSMKGSSLPKFISVECHTLKAVRELAKLGYDHFQLVNQTLHNVVQPPHPPREGEYLGGYRFRHASGYFGNELPSQWVDFDQAVELHANYMKLKKVGLVRGWLDCHCTIGPLSQWMKPIDGVAT